MGIDVQIGDSLIRIISAYAPTEVNPDTDSKDIFYSELEKTMKSKKKYSGILIGSDTNATNEVAKYRSYFGKDGILIPSSENTNDNGIRLECFVNNNKMCLSSTFFEKNPEDRITWYSNDKKKIIDHVIASPAIQKTTSNCGVNNELDFLSDHRCVTANIKTT